MRLSPPREPPRRPWVDLDRLAGYARLGWPQQQCGFSGEFFLPWGVPRRPPEVNALPVIGRRRLIRSTGKEPASRKNPGLRRGKGPCHAA